MTDEEYKGYVNRLRTTAEIDPPKATMKVLLSEVEQALDDWIVTYAADHCSEESVRTAWKRIFDNGGTISYVTDLRDRVTKAKEQLP